MKQNWVVGSTLHEKKKIWYMPNKIIFKEIRSLGMTLHTSFWDFRNGNIIICREINESKMLSKFACF